MGIVQSLNDENENLKDENERLRKENEVLKLKLKNYEDAEFERTEARGW